VILGSYLKDPNWDWIIAAEIDRSQAYSEAKRKLLKSIRSSAILQVIALLFLYFSVAFFVKRLIITPIKQVVDNLNSNVSRVNTSSSLVADNSKKIARGTGSQAASLEQIAATVQELTAVCKKSYDNTQNASVIMTKQIGSAGESLKSIDQVTKEIKVINDECQQMSSIIKTIDEIAFQTNLLALNAAVEAARAGEAGKGFAVVAEEVRNLAQRAATAAKSTQELIEANVTKVADTSNKMDQVSDNFNEMTGQANKTSQILKEILSAAKDQTEQIMQINDEINVLDTGTQQNAASADHSADEATTLHDQCENVKTIIRNLGKMVGLDASAVEQKAGTQVKAPDQNQDQGPVKLIE